MNKVSITINSRQYTVMAEESVEYIEALGEHINEKVELVLGSGSNIMGERPIVLAALNICDEYFKVNEAGYVINEQLARCREKLELKIDENKKLQSKIEELELRTNDTQMSIDETGAAVSELEDKLQKAENRVKFLEGQLNLMKSKNGRN